MTSSSALVTSCSSSRSSNTRPTEDDIHWQTSAAAPSSASSATIPSIHHTHCRSNSSSNSNRRIGLFALTTTTTTGDSYFSSATSTTDAAITASDPCSSTGASSNDDDNDETTSDGIRKDSSSSDDDSSTTSYSNSDNNVDFHNNNNNNNNNNNTPKKRPAEQDAVASSFSCGGGGGGGGGHQQQRFQKRFKRTTSVVKRTHSPIASSSSSSGSSTMVVVQNRSMGFELQVQTPTVHGIKEVARHLIQEPTLSPPQQNLSLVLGSKKSLNLSHNDDESNNNRDIHPLLALPTECTYELCTLISWRKNETSTKESVAFRDDRIQQMTWSASDSSPSFRTGGCQKHVYLPHDNIKQIGRLLDFPKKAYAVKQNPKEVSAFNEGRLVFQQLADEFWPGPVLLYLRIVSSSDDTKTNNHTTGMVPEPLQLDPPRQIQQMMSGTTTSTTKYVGFRCPSHPLTVKVMKQIRRAAGSSSVMVGSPVSKHNHASTLTSTGDDSSDTTNNKTLDTLLVQAKDVIQQFTEIGLPSTTTITTTATTMELAQTTPSKPPRASIQVLHGEEKKEIFSVPTCQFQDEWLECWIVEESRTVVLRGKSRRKIRSQLLLRDAPNQNRVVRSVLGQWRVVDQRAAAVDSNTMCSSHHHGEQQQKRTNVE